MQLCMHAMHAYVGACMPCMHMPLCIRNACICRCGHAGAYIYAYACICMHMVHGMHISLAWGAHPGYPTHVGGPCNLAPRTCICLDFVYVYLYFYVTIMYMYAYECICMHMLHGMHIPLAWGAHPGYPARVGGGTVKPGTQDIYIYIYLHSPW